MMAKLSDEIREWCDSADVDGDACGELRDLADRIDSDMEMVELPRSADGYIWTSYESCFWTGSEDEDRHKFDGLHYANSMWCVEDNYSERYPAASVWYNRPDSLGRIAGDLDEMVDAARSADDMREKLADLAYRIRKLAAKEDKR